MCASLCQLVELKSTGQILGDACEGNTSDPKTPPNPRPTSDQPMHGSTVGVRSGIFCLRSHKQAPRTNTGRMFEARLTQGGLLKKLVDVVKDVNDNCNFDCSSKGFGLQAIDNAHVAGVVDAARRRL